MKVLESDIIDKYLVCPYCMNQVSFDRLGCCGESSAHFVKAYELEDGDCYLCDDVEVIEGGLDV